MYLHDRSILHSSSNLKVWSACCFPRTIGEGLRSATGSYHSCIVCSTYFSKQNTFGRNMYRLSSCMDYSIPVKHWGANMPFGRSYSSVQVPASNEMMSYRFRMRADTDVVTEKYQYHRLDTHNQYASVDNSGLHQWVSPQMVLVGV